MRKGLCEGLINMLSLQAVSSSFYQVVIPQVKKDVMLMDQVKYLSSDDQEVSGDEVYVITLNDESSTMSQKFALLE